MACFIEAFDKALIANPLYPPADDAIGGFVVLEDFINIVFQYRKSSNSLSQRRFGTDARNCGLNLHTR